MKRWSVSRQGKLWGPYTLPQLQAMAASGALMPDDLICPEGGVVPCRAKTLAGLFSPAPPPPVPVIKPATPAIAALAPVPVARAAKAPAPAQVPTVSMPSADRNGSAAAPSAGLTALKLLVPVALLALPLFGLVVSDFVRDLKKPTTLQVLDDTVAAKAALHDATAQTKPAKAQILDEPDEVLIQPTKFKIDDEPEERIAQLAPVKVEIKDEPSDDGATAIDKTPLVKYALLVPPEGPLPPLEFRDARVGSGTARLPLKPGIAFPTHPLAFGVSTTAAAGPAKNKLLTWAANGLSNTLVLRVNGSIAEAGAPPWRVVRAAATELAEGIVPTPGGVSPTQSTLVIDDPSNVAKGLRFHQVLEVVPGLAGGRLGTAGRQLDTVLVRWVLDNQSARPCKVGLRLHLDTLIGANDGVPFTVPGLPGLVTKSADFRKAEDVPDFIEALEVPDLQNPGAVAHLTAKVGGDLEPPDRLSLTCQQFWGFGFSPSKSWDYPIEDMRFDSAVILYWSDKEIKPGGRRVLGFAYGLGAIASSKLLAITVGGSFDPGQTGTVTAYVEKPQPGQTLRLELPDGLKHVGAATQDVLPAATGTTSLVTWKVQVERTGTFRMVVRSSTGTSQAKTLVISRADAATGKLTLELAGSFAPGQIFDVVGRVAEPVAGQTLTFNLPAGLECIDGKLMRDVAAAAKGVEAQVRWKVKVLQSGKFPVRVVSSTGSAQTKTITIAPQTALATNFRIALDGDFSPGKLFTVTAKVSAPVPDQTLTLQLPAGLERIGGAPVQAVPPGLTPTLSWQVKILQAGKFSLGVASSTGVTQKKSLVIGAPEGGRFTFELVGDIRVGKTFDVVASIAEPVVGQSLTLTLPKELKLAGSADKQPVDVTGPQATITWRVQVVEAGRLPVRIESSTGLARSKMIVLSQETDSTLFGR